MNSLGRKFSALALLAAGLTACGRADAPSDLTVRVQFTPDPPRVGPSELLLELFDGEQRPIEGALVRVEGNMNHAGMVPEITAAKEISSGRYAADLEFTMGGDWFLVVSARTEEGAWLETTVPVPGVRTESAESSGAE